MDNEQDKAVKELQRIAVAADNIGANLRDKGTVNTATVNYETQRLAGVVVDLAVIAGVLANRIMAMESIVLLPAEDLDGPDPWDQDDPLLNGLQGGR